MLIVMPRRRTLCVLFFISTEKSGKLFYVTSRWNVSASFPLLLFRRLNFGAFRCKILMARYFNLSLRILQRQWNILWPSSAFLSQQESNRDRYMANRSSRSHARQLSECWVRNDFDLRSFPLQSLPFFRRAHKDFHVFLARSVGCDIKFYFLSSNYPRRRNASKTIKLSLSFQPESTFDSWFIGIE